MLRVLSAALLLLACSESHALQSDAGAEAGTDAAIPGEIDTLRVDGDETWIEALAVDSHDVLCALVSRPFASGRELVYGCFADGLFTSRAQLASAPRGSPAIWGFQLDSRDMPSMILGAWDAGFELEIAGHTVTEASCWIHLIAGEVRDVCIAAPVALLAVAFDTASGRSAAILQIPETGASIGALALTTGAYVVDGLPVVDAAQLHPFTPGNVGPTYIGADGAGGWALAGSYVSALADGWGLPVAEQQTAFTLRVDAAFEPTSARLYDPRTVLFTSTMERAGHLLSVGSTYTETVGDMHHALVIDDRGDTIPFGHGGQTRAIASSAEVIAILFDVTGDESMTFGTTTLTRPGRAGLDAVVTLSRGGDVLTARAMPLTGEGARGLAMFADGSVAVAQGSVVHVLSAR